VEKKSLIIPWGQWLQKKIRRIQIAHVIGGWMKDG
jgi:hypothetical protein